MPFYLVERKTFDGFLSRAILAANSIIVFCDEICVSDPALSLSSEPVILPSVSMAMVAYDAICNE